MRTCRLWPDSEVGLLDLTASGKDTGASETSKGFRVFFLVQGSKLYKLFGCFGLAFSLWKGAMLNIRASMRLARPRIPFHFPVLLCGWSWGAGLGGRNLSRQ